MRRRLFVLLAVLGTTNACALTGISYTQDHRVSFVSPDDRATVTLPLTVRWRFEDFEVGRGAGSFAVFVDRAPQPRGKTLKWFGDDDTQDIYETTAPSVTIDRAPRRTAERRQRHEVTVILLDERGRRIAETGWSLEFEVER
jgi:hypothetical protein